jgi:hypothetical protein
MKDDLQIAPVRIYLTFTKEQSIITIHQISKLLNGEMFLQRERRIRKPYDTHMRIGLGGVIATTMGKYRELYKNKVTHIGIYLSHDIAMEVLEKNIKYIEDKREITIFIFEKLTKQIK